MRMPRLLTVPANESHMAVALCAAAVVMGLLLLGIVWQAEVIGEQREVIRWLWGIRG